MTQRTWAALLAVPLFLALGFYIASTELPFVTFAPGPTINVLGKNDAGKPIIEVQGHRTYRDGGQLRMTTVSESEPGAKLDLLTLERAWLSPSLAVYPYSAVYSAGETTQQSAHAGQQQMLTSQQTAEAAALTQLGYHVQHPQVTKVDSGLPAAGHLQVKDVVQSVDGTAVTTPQDVSDAIQAAPSGRPVTFVVRRSGTEVTEQVTPVEKGGKKIVGITLAPSYHFPFPVKINLSDSIGGPSAGLMFALSIYDTLTPGSLTHGQAVAGTGEITPDGQVGEIGGIQQKIIGAKDDGAQLFLVPPANCPDAITSRHGSMRLVRAPTLHSAIRSIKAWTANHDATLPMCRSGS